MRLTVIRSSERGRTEGDGVHSRHSFSFQDHFNLVRMGFGPLRVMNEEIMEPGKGNPSRFHKDFELVSIVFEGTLEYGDTSGTKDVLQAGQMHVVSLGKGSEHTERNPSSAERLHFMHIWFEADKDGIKPRVQKKPFSFKKNKLVLAASPDRSKDCLKINQDAMVYLGEYARNQSFSYPLEAGSGMSLFLLKGSLHVRDKIINRSDSVEISGKGKVQVTALDASRFILIDVPV